MLLDQMSLCCKKLQRTDQNNKATTRTLQHKPNLTSNEINSAITESVDSPEHKNNPMHALTYKHIQAYINTTSHYVTSIATTHNPHNTCGSFPKCICACSTDWPITLVEKKDKGQCKVTVVGGKHRQRAWTMFK